MNFAVDHCRADRTARAAERSKLPPCVGRGIVFENEIECPDMNIFGEAADRVELAVESDSPDMGHCMREGSAVTPAICRRVVLLIEPRSCIAECLPAEDIDLIVHRSDARLGALGEKRCLCRPSSLRSGRLKLRGSSKWQAGKDQVR